MVCLGTGILEFPFFLFTDFCHYHPPVPVSHVVKVRVQEGQSPISFSAPTLTPAMTLQFLLISILHQLPQQNCTQSTMVGQNQSQNQGQQP